MATSGKMAWLLLLVHLLPGISCQFSQFLAASGVYSPGDTSAKIAPQKSEKISAKNSEKFHPLEPEQPLLLGLGKVREPKQIEIFQNNDDSEFPSGRSLPAISHPLPNNLGFPSVMGFFNNFDSNVDWSSGRSKRSASLLGTPSLVLPPPSHIPPPNHLPLFPPLDKPLVLATPLTPVPIFHPAAQTSHPHTPLPHPTSLPLQHHPAHPTSHSVHHVSITTPSHHVSHGVVDHGTHHEVTKEHHQFHGHEHHPTSTPVVLVHKIGHMPTPIHVEHKGHLGHHVPPPVVSGYPTPAHGASLEAIFGVSSKYHTPEPAYHPPEPAYHPPEPAYHAPEPVYHAPEPAYHAPEPAYHPLEPAYHPPEPTYHPPQPVHHASGYAVPKHGASLEEIFGVASKYHAPKPAYSPLEPAHHALEPAYHPPEPAYHHPEPAYHAPEPAYHALVPIHHPPEPAYHPPEPAYHAPEPAYHPPEPAYHPPEPAYHALEPAYHAPKPNYKPDYSHPSGDYIPPSAHMAGHPFSLEHVFALGMPDYYMKKYPHMAHDLPHHHPPEPAYHEPKPAYVAPKGYPVPKHGASLEEIFGVHTKYHNPPHYAPNAKPGYNLLEGYHGPEPVYHPPPPPPAYHPPPTPVYHPPPTPAYHPPPTPAYHPPKPTYDEPTGYAQPHHGASLEQIFGIKSKYHAPVHALPPIHPTPDYHLPPPTPAYHPPPPAPAYHPPPANPAYKSLPVDHHSPPGYTLHYLPYEDYEPLHPATLDHPPPVPHHPGAAHILVPNSHHLPAPTHLPDINFGARVKRSPQNPEFVLEQQEATLK